MLRGLQLFLESNLDLIITKMKFFFSICNPMVFLISRSMLSPLPSDVTELQCMNASNRFFASKLNIQRNGDIDVRLGIFFYIDENVHQRSRVHLFSLHLRFFLPIFPQNIEMELLLPVAASARKILILLKIMTIEPVSLKITCIISCNLHLRIFTFFYHSTKQNLPYVGL